MDTALPVIKKYLYGGDLYALNYVSKNIREILDLKYINPIRLIFLKLNTCTVCNKKTNLIKKTSVSCEFSEYGWETCDNCRPSCLYSRTRYLLQKASIPYSCVYNYCIFDSQVINFYDTDNKIKHGSHACNFGNLFYKNHENTNIYTVVNSSESLTSRHHIIKEIKLQNLIFCNRKLCGYKYTKFPFRFKNTIDFFTKQQFNKILKSLYNEVNEFYILLLCLNNSNIPKEIKMIIFKYWINIL